MTPDVLADLLRLAVAGLACLAIGSIAVVFVRYLWAWKRAPRKHGALPRHVTGVSAGALGLVIGYGWIIYQRVGRETTVHWTSILLLISLLVLAVAVIDVGGLQGRRVAAARERAAQRSAKRTEQQAQQAPTRQTRPQSSVPLNREHDPVDRSGSPGRHHRRP